MRKGIVAGEPGIFPWPFGPLYGRLSRWLGHRRGPEPEPEPGPPAGPDDPKPPQAAPREV